MSVGFLHGDHQRYHTNETWAAYFAEGDSTQYCTLLRLQVWGDLLTR